MARKLFGMIEAGAKGVVDEDEVLDAGDAAEATSPAPRVGGRSRPSQDSGATSNRILSASRLSKGLMDLQSHTVRDLDPDSIISGGMLDRLSAEDDGVARLSESIREHGQHVPVLVRPMPGEVDRFEIIYGRRRLAAIRRLGGDMTVKAIVRNLPDEDAVIAQGQENNQRLDPSHIEKALFAQELRRKQFSNDVIREALNVDKFAVSKLVKLAETVPPELIEMIGPAHDIGRRPWTQLAELITAGKADVIAIAAEALEKSEASASSDRFRAVMDAMKRASVAASQQNVAAQQLVHGPTERVVGDPKQGPRLHFKSSRSAVSLRFDTKEDPEFSRWLEENVDDVVSDLQQRWKRATKAQ